MQTALSEKINDMLDILSPREATVLKLRYGIGIEQPMTLEEIGKLPEMKITRERVRQIENKALRKLRHNQTVRSLRDYVRAS